MIMTLLIFIGGVFAIGSSSVCFVAFLLQIEHSQVSEPENCECSICKRKATERTAEEPMAKTPPMKIRSVKIIQGELETLLAETTNSRAQRRTRTAKSTQNPATARILKQIKGDCVPGAGSLKSKDCIRNPKTPPRSRRQTMLIRSIRVDEEEPRMSSRRTPPPPDHSEDVPPAPGTIAFSPALENAFQAVRTHRHRHRPEVTVESLRRTSFALSPATATSAIVASGSFVAHPRSFADVAASISPSATPNQEPSGLQNTSADPVVVPDTSNRDLTRFRALLQLRSSTGNNEQRWNLVTTATPLPSQNQGSNTTPPTLLSAPAGTNPPRSSPATTVASIGSTQIGARTLTSSQSSSTHPRPSENDATDSPFPAETPTPTTSGIIQGITSSNVPTTVAPTSTSISVEEPQRPSSTHTGPILASDLDEDRSPIQTTVDDIGRLVEQFQRLGFEDHDQFFRQVVTTIPPIIRSQHGQRAG